MRKRLVILAWVHIVIGGAGLAAFAALVGAFVMARDPEYNDEFAVIGGVLGGFSLFYFGPMFLGGLGLLRRKVWGRALIFMHAPLLALAVPVGTLITGFGLWALMTTSGLPEDGGVAYVERFIRRWFTFFLCALAAIAILGAIIGMGWLFRDQIDPPGKQVLTPMPEMPKFEPPVFNPPQQPAAPGQ